MFILFDFPCAFSRGIQVFFNVRLLVISTTYEFLLGINVNLNFNGTFLNAGFIGENLIFYQKIENMQPPKMLSESL